MPNTSAKNHMIEMNFEAIKLFPGAVMQIQALAEGTQVRHEVRFIGFIKDHSLLVTLPVQEGKGIWMQPGQTFVMRGFNGIHAYAFRSQVIRARSHPFTYIHFTWPNKAECQIVRHSLRVNAALPAKITLADNSAVSATMLDMSVSGSMLDSPSGLGSVGDHLKIEFTVKVEESDIKLNLSAIIRNIQKKDNDTGFRIGIGFENVSQNDGLALHYYTHTLAQKTHV